MGVLDSYRSRRAPRRHGRHRDAWQHPNYGASLHRDHNRQGVALLYRNEATAFNRQFILVTLNPIHERLLASGVSAQVIYRRVMRNLVDPRRKLELSPVMRQRAIDLYENLLGQIQRGVIIADH